MAVLVFLTGLFLLSAWLWQYIDSTNLSPEMFQDFPEHSKALGYDTERYDLITGDRYGLTIFRILSPTGSRGKPLLLVHGVGVNGDQFAINYHTKPMAYQFTEAGYDVWVANTRGSHYSDRHETLSIEDPEYWDWTVEDIVLQDMPAIIDTITRETNSTVAYLGHSQGAAVGLALLSMLPRYSKHISIVLAVACPSSQNSNESWLSKVLTSPVVIWFFELIGKDSFFRRSSSLWFEKVLKRFPTIGYYYLRSRYDSELNNDVFGKSDVYSYRLAGGISLKSLKFFSQNINPTDPRLKRFDYGAEENLQRYGSVLPPWIDFSNITSPMAFFGGEHDQMVKQADLDALLQILPQDKIVFKKTDYPHDHGSFTLSQNMDHMEDMLKVLKAYA